MYVSHLIGALGSGHDNVRGIYEYPENIITAKGTNGNDDDGKIKVSDKYSYTVELHNSNSYLSFRED